MKMLTKPNTLRLVFFLAAFAGALYYPVNRILAIERPKSPPTEFRFKVEAYDPYDPMRGRYLLLNLQSEIDAPEKSAFPAADRPLLALIGKDKDGMAVVEKLLPADSEVPSGRSFVKVGGFWHTGTFNNKSGTYEAPYKYHFTLPFSRYFINEKLADDAEAMLANITRSEDHTATLVVNIYPDGLFAVTDLLIDGKPITEMLRQEAAEK